MNFENLIKKTRRELVQLARRFDIRARTTMRKHELIAALLDPEKAAAKPGAEPKPRPRPAPSAVEPAAKAATAPQPQAATSPMAQPRPVPAAPIPTLPRTYGDNRIVLLVRDPYWLFAYWEIQPDRVDAGRAHLGPAFDSARWVLRVYDITGIAFDGFNAHSFFDIDLVGSADNWYIEVPEDDHCYCADIGIRAGDGRFYVLARSNQVETPRARISDVVDEAWASRERESARIFAIAGGAGPLSASLGLREIMERRLRGMFASPGVSSFVGSGRR